MNAHPLHNATYPLSSTHFHFIGIGGIGMSGIASILAQQGHKVSGCDANIDQISIQQLTALGCSIHEHNNSTYCNDESITVLVYIPMYANTIPAVIQEINNGRQRNITILSRAQLLAQLMAQKYSIAIAGSHGKTTTTSLISHILLSAQKSPTVVVGGQLKNISSNAYNGNGDIIVAEADESDRSFLELHPDIAVVTNIDLEHLETYKDLPDIITTFQRFLTHIRPQGTVIACADDQNINVILPYIRKPIITYGIEKEAHVRAHSITLLQDSCIFTVQCQNDSQEHNIHLPLPGKHNIYNALAAIATTRTLTIEWNTIVKHLASFKGVERRFSYHGMYKGAEIFDDYGHHPQEIKCTLEVARKRAKNKLIVVFQPHRYTRTEKLWHDFITTFSTSLIDILIITDIYSAGEKPISYITGKKLVTSIHTAYPSIKVHYAPFEEDFHSIKQLISNHTEHNDLILFLGAGKMNLIAEEIIQ